MNDRLRRNPYADLGDRGQWLRGSFHGHCDENSACASVPLAEGVRRYREVGAGIVTLTDHDVVTDLTGLQAAHPDTIFVHGFEYSSRENVVFAGAEVPPLHEQSLEDALAAAGELFTMVCHPQPNGAAREYWTRAKLEALGTRPDGLEVYNGHYGIPAARAHGRQPYYADFWDELLTAGYRVWGFANDDFHDSEDFGNAWNMVWVERADAAGVVAAAKAGRCYATTGVLLEEAAVDGQRLTVRVDRPCHGRFLGPGGVVLAEAEGTEFAVQAGDEAYVRFEGDGPRGRIFLQPFYRID